MSYGHAGVGARAAAAAGMLLCLCALARAAEAQATRPGIAVIDTHVLGADPAVGALVTERLRRVAGSLGYAPAPQGSTRTSLAQLRAPGPLTPAQARQVASVAGVPWAVVANVRGEGGRYRVEIVVASTWPAGPFVSSRSASALELPSAVDELARSLLPPASSRPRVPPAAPPRSPLWLALRTEGALGVSGAGFYNHLAGGRLDYWFSPSVAGGVSVAYVNLKGKEGRASNVLPAAVLQHRLDLGRSWGLPLRITSGYLPRNGPVLRLSAGLAYDVGGSARIGLDLLALTLWSTRDETVYSFDLAAEVSFAL